MVFIMAEAGAIVIYQNRLRRNQRRRRRRNRRKSRLQSQKQSRMTSLRRGRRQRETRKQGRYLQPIQMILRLWLQRLMHRGYLKAAVTTLWFPARLHGRCVYRFMHLCTMGYPDPTRG